jgi:hypothetical protein
MLNDDDLMVKNEKLNQENAKLLAELITAKEEIKQLNLQLKKHEDRIKSNEALLL